MPFPDLIVARDAVGALVITLDVYQGSECVLNRIPAGISRSRAACICIKMASGSFAEYSDTSMLHAGLSDSCGRVHHFDETGHHLDDHWSESICIPLVPSLQGSDACAAEQLLWDSVLASFHDAHARADRRYDSLSYNCYTYVVEFLRATQFRGRRDHTIETVEELITGPVDRALEYLELVRCAPRAALQLPDSWMQPRFGTGGELAY